MSPRLLLLCIGIALLPVAVASADEPWLVLRDSRFVPENYHDGDSFSIRTQKKDAKRSYTYIFRLYGADCPESNSDQEPERIVEQASYFRLPPADITRWGHAAADFTAKALQSGKVTIITRKSEAGGQSRKNRYYAFVQIDGQDLATLLVENGLARAYGQSVEYDGQTADQYRRLLDRKERTARRNRSGIWSESQLPH